MTWNPYFDVGQAVWIDGYCEGKVEGYSTHNPKMAIVRLRSGFFAHKSNDNSSMEYKGHDTFVSSMLVHVSNLSVSEFGEKPYKGVE